jgi:hemoglobin-like flavoprotein
MDPSVNALLINELGAVILSWFLGDFRAYNALRRQVAEAVGALDPPTCVTEPTNRTTIRERLYAQSIDRWGCVMTPDRQQLVQETWRNVEPHQARLVELAALHLVEIVPTTRALFPNDTMPAICRSVADVLSRLIATLDEPKQFVPLAVGLGRSNPDVGVSARLYPAMGEALTWALHLHLGDAFTPELQTAWRECHQLATALMRRAEQSRTGEFEQYRTGEFAAYQAAAAREAQLST